jgi:hypothetical protein
MVDTKETDCTERAEEIGVKFAVFAARVRLLMAKLYDCTTVSLHYGTRWRVHKNSLQVAIVV